jgi:hypothetical protein
MSQHRQQEPLAWLAYRYVADELSVGEAADFEERLAVDQAARETVAEVVRLSAAVQALPSDAFYDRELAPSVWRQRACWAALGAAACLLLTLGAQFLLGRASPTGNQARGEPTPLALAWAEAHSAAGDSSEVDQQDDSFDASQAMLGEPTDDAATWDAPDWLLDAVDDARQSAQPSSGENQNREQTP